MRLTEHQNPITKYTQLHTLIPKPPVRLEKTRFKEGGGGGRDKGGRGRGGGERRLANQVVMTLKLSGQGRREAVGMRCVCVCVCGGGGGTDPGGQQVQDASGNMSQGKNHPYFAALKHVSM